ncbi:hypothetical protein PMAYCL1PPCAC_13592, partial [Pristionchus mayeri]
ETGKEEIANESHGLDGDHCASDFHLVEDGECSSGLCDIAVFNVEVLVLHSGVVILPSVGEDAQHEGCIQHLRRDTVETEGMTKDR